MRPPDRPSDRRRRIVRARRLVVRTVVGTCVGLVLLLVSGLAAPALGVTHADLGLDALLGFAAAGSRLMIAFARSPPARWVLRTTRRIATAALDVAG